MHVQVVNFNLAGMNEEEWQENGKRLAPKYVDVPGLVAKIWIKDPDENRFGAIYVWGDGASMDAFAKSDLGQRIRNHPNYENLSISSFEVIGDLTRITAGELLRQEPA